MMSFVADAGAVAAARTGSALWSAARGHRLSILIFHRVLAAPDPLFPGEMDLARFERLMRLVQRSFRVLPLCAAVAHLKAGTLPARALAISFDDGYADNHDLAWPVLKRLGLPATIFVSTGFLDGGRMWNDSVIESVRLSGRDTLDLPSLDIAQAPLHTAAQRSALIKRLLPRIKYMTLAGREQALADLHLACGSPRLPSDLMMRSDQVQALHRDGVEIGGHTVHHPILAALADDEAEQEIVQGRAVLQDLLDQPVSLFAYPNGRPGKDYDQRHVAMLKRLGFAAALSTESGVSRTGDDLFQLRRFTPWDQDATRWLGRLAAHHCLN